MESIEITNCGFKPVTNCDQFTKTPGEQSASLRLHRAGSCHAFRCGVLRSSKAIQVNIAIMRAFVALRRYALTYAELSEKIAALEAKFGLEIADIHEVLRQLAEGGGELKNWDNRSRIGFKSDKITS